MLRLLFSPVVLFSLIVFTSGCDRPPQVGQVPPLTPAEEIALRQLASNQLAPLSLGGQDYLLLASAVRGLVLLDRSGQEAISLDGGKVLRFSVQEIAADTWLVAAYDESALEIQLRQVTLDADTGRPRLSYLGVKAHEEPLRALCLARQGGDSHLFAIDHSGQGREYALHPGEGSWEFSEVRQLYLGEDVSGCVVDDVNGRLLVAQPPLGIWSLNADAQRGEERAVFINGAQIGDRFGGLWIEPGRGTLWLTAGDRLMAFSLGRPGEALFTGTLPDLQPVSVAVQGEHLLALDRERDRVRRYLAQLPEPMQEMQASADSRH